MNSDTSILEQWYGLCGEIFPVSADGCDEWFSSFRHFYEIFERNENFGESQSYSHGFPQHVENAVENPKIELWKLYPEWISIEGSIGSSENIAVFDKSAGKNIHSNIKDYKILGSDELWKTFLSDIEAWSYRKYILDKM